MNIILAIILLIFIGACLYGIYLLLGRVINGVPLAAAGIILILLFLLIGYYLITGGIPRIGAQDRPQERFKSEYRSAFIPGKSESSI